MKKNALPNMLVMAQFPYLSSEFEHKVKQVYISLKHAAETHIFA